jgi:hypothetical protein
MFSIVDNVEAIFEAIADAPSLTKLCWRAIYKTLPIGLLPLMFRPVWISWPRRIRRDWGTPRRTQI